MYGRTRRHTRERGYPEVLQIPGLWSKAIALIQHPKAILANSIIHGIRGDVGAVWRNGFNCNFVKLADLGNFVLGSFELYSDCFLATGL